MPSRKESIMTESTSNSPQTSSHLSPPKAPRRRRFTGDFKRDAVGLVIHEKDSFKATRPITHAQPTFIIDGVCRALLRG